MKTFIINYSKCNSNNIHNAFNNFSMDIHIANRLLDNSIEIIKSQKEIINEIVGEGARPQVSFHPQQFHL